MKPSSTVRIAAMSYGSDFKTAAKVVEAEPVVANSEAEFWRFNILEPLYIAIAGADEPC